MPSLYTVETPEKGRARREEETRESEPQAGPRAGSGFFRGLLFAVPGALLLWTLLILAARALLPHL